MENYKNLDRAMDKIENITGKVTLCVFVLLEEKHSSDRRLWFGCTLWECGSSSEMSASLKGRRSRSDSAAHGRNYRRQTFLFVLRRLNLFEPCQIGLAEKERTVELFLLFVPLRPVQT